MTVLDGWSALQRAEKEVENLKTQAFLERTNRLANELHDFKRYIHTLEDVSNTGLSTLVVERLFNIHKNLCLLCNVTADAGEK